jgi:chemotaxis signal transduction protein
VVAHNEEAEVALLVDRVSDLVTLAAAALDPPPAALDIQRARLLRGVARLDDQPLAMIDMAGLIAAVRTG